MRCRRVHPQSRFKPNCCCRRQVQAMWLCSLRGDARVGLGTLPLIGLGWSIAWCSSHIACVGIRHCARIMCRRMDPNPDLTRFDVAGAKCKLYSVAVLSVACASASVPSSSGAGPQHHVVLASHRVVRHSTLCKDEVLPRAPQSRFKPNCCCMRQVQAM